MTDIKNVSKYIEIVQKYPRNISKKFQKISQSEEEIFLYWPNFSKEVSQLADSQGNKKFSNIWK